MDAESATRAIARRGAVSAQSQSGCRLQLADTGEHARRIRHRSIVAGLSLPLSLCLIIATMVQLPGDVLAQVQPDTNTKTDVDTSEESELERRLRELTGGGSVPAIANPVVLRGKAFRFFRSVPPFPRCDLNLDHLLKRKPPACWARPSTGFTQPTTARTSY